VGLLSRTIAKGGLFALFIGLQSAMPANAGGVALTAERMSLLQQVNSHVNATIQEVSDMEQYGREDVWRIPTSGKGDCEDFALLKRQMLVQRGFPASALSVIVGTNSQGEAHAVLQVSTEQGAYVLDNQRSGVVSLAQSGFTTYSRQTNRGFVSTTTGEASSAPYADFVIGPAKTVAGRGRRG
jgi:predicted transglutaminase-like cysteine proteinase